jgi:ABC-type nitrate/sulfonate/bicarbonate transport system ATPase subunit
MLLDEPFSALDMLTKNQMHQWYLSTMEKHHLSTLLITHDIEEAILLSDRILILENASEASETNLIKEVIVTQPRPRSQDFIFTRRFADLKQELWRAVLGE